MTQQPPGEKSNPLAATRAPLRDLLRAATRTRLPLLGLGLFLAVSFLTRAALLAVTLARGGNGPLAALAALGSGALFDLLAGLWVVSPWVLFTALAPERWFRHRLQRGLTFVGFAIGIYTLLFVAAIEGFFFSEFDGRFNFVAVDYLLYPTEVLTNMRESYPLVPILALVAALTGALLFALRSAVVGAFARPASWRERIGALAVTALFTAGLSWGVSPQLAHVGEDRTLNEVAINGWYSFWSALTGSSAPYEGLYATGDRREVFDRLHRLLAGPGSDPSSFRADSTTRHVLATRPETRKNVVVVLEESFGSEFVGALHPSSRSLTPRFDALAARGTLLTHAYATGNRTIRAIEATTASLPPLPGISIVRRPQSENLFTLPALLRQRGYQTMFVYGGRALFDGMGRYVRRNGIDRVIEQADMPDGAFHTAWGVADEVIFARALAEMDTLHATGKPFYSLVLSVSNHRPFTFPTQNLQPDPALSRRENVVRYADDALGRFVAEAERHPFFADTLFVLMGDHGARVYGAAEIPLASYEVPILFYAPGFVATARYDSLASSLDVPPTVLALLGLSYDSKFFGRDLFAEPPGVGRALMTHNAEIAMRVGDRVAVLGLRGSTRLFQVDGDRFLPIATFDPEGAELVRDTIAYYYGAHLLYQGGAYFMHD